MSHDTGRLSRVLAGGLFALFFGALIQALTVFEVITVSTGHIFMFVAWVAGAVLITTELIPGKTTRHKAIWVAALGLVLLCVDLLCARYAAMREREAATPVVMPAVQQQPTPLRGVLLPGNDPPRPYACKPKEGQTVFYFGALTAISNSMSQPIVRIDGEDVVSFERSRNGGFYINALVRGPDHSVVAQIIRNAFSVPPRPGYYMASPDEHTLIVLDPDNKKVLYVRYLNPSTVEVFGVFYREKLGPVVASEVGADYIRRGGPADICVESGGGSEPIFEFVE